MTFITNAWALPLAAECYADQSRWGCDFDYPEPGQTFGDRFLTVNAGRRLPTAEFLLDLLWVVQSDVHSEMFPRTPSPMSLLAAILSFSLRCSAEADSES